MASITHHHGHASVPLRALEGGLIIMVVVMMVAGSIGLAGGASARSPEPMRVGAPSARPHAGDWQGIPMPPMQDATGEAGL